MVGWQLPVVWIRNAGQIKLCVKTINRVLLRRICRIIVLGYGHPIPAVIEPIGEKLSVQNAIAEGKVDAVTVIKTVREPPVIKILKQAFADGI